MSTTEQRTRREIIRAHLALVDGDLGYAGWVVAIAQAYPGECLGHFAGALAAIDSARDALAIAEALHHCPQGPQNHRPVARARRGAGAISIRNATIPATARRAGSALTAGFSSVAPDSRPRTCR